MPQPGILRVQNLNLKGISIFSGCNCQKLNLKRRVSNSEICITLKFLDVFGAFCWRGSSFSGFNFVLGVGSWIGLASYKQGAMWCHVRSIPVLIISGYLSEQRSVGRIWARRSTMPSNPFLMNAICSLTDVRLQDGAILQEYFLKLAEVILPILYLLLKHGTFLLKKQSKRKNGRKREQFPELDR